MLAITTNRLITRINKSNRVQNQPNQTPDSVDQSLAKPKVSNPLKLLLLKSVLQNFEML